MQDIIVIGIVLTVILYIIHSLLNIIRKDNNRGCGNCAGCSQIIQKIEILDKSKPLKKNLLSSKY